MRRIDRRLLRSVIFCGGAVLLFGIISYVFIPKRFPYMKDNDVGKISSYFDEKENSIDVLICGPSHAARGILPMELYESYGIKAYNLSSPAQPIEATYYILKEALRTQKPVLFVYDVSGLYFSREELYWRHVLDEMPFGKNKIALAKECVKSGENVNASVAELMVPFLGYHARWNGLTEEDFDKFRSKQYYNKGGTVVSTIVRRDISVETMNWIAGEMLQDTERVECGYNSEGGGYEKREESIAYNVAVPDDNLKWFLKIKQLCDEDNIQFLAIKIPTVYYPQIYQAAWVEEKYHRLRRLCDEYRIEYYDLQYEIDLNLNMERDSCDGGMHLNLNGARKVCIELGDYLKKHYELPEENDEEWNRDLRVYQEQREIAQLELEQDFSAYITALTSTFKNKTIFIAASDMLSGLSDDEKIVLQGLGLHSDFSDGFRDAYIAVIEDGEVQYEALSNRQLEYEGVCGKFRKKYNLHSSGWKTTSKTSITLFGREYTVSDRGISIVVYDDTMGVILDSVCFDTSQENHKAVRDNKMINDFMEEIERYLIENN